VFGPHGATVNNVSSLLLFLFFFYSVHNFQYYRALLPFAETARFTTPPFGFVLFPLFISPGVLRAPREKREYLDKWKWNIISEKDKLVPVDGAEYNGLFATATE